MSIDRIASDIIVKQLQCIRETAPSACGLEDCYDLETAIRVLLQFAWQAVSGSADSDLHESHNATLGEVTAVLEQLDELARVWGDEGVFRSCRDRLRKIVKEQP